MEDWNTVFHYSFKCINNFKNNVGLENYLALLQRGLRIEFAKIRTYNHRLPVETGKVKTIDRIKRICNLTQTL